MVLAVSAFPQQSPLSEEGFGLFEQANTAYIRFARWLSKQQESMKPKAFRELLLEHGMIRREATKFIKLASVSSSFVPSDLAKLGLMMFSLLTPRYEQLWSEMLDQGELTQDVVDGLKKQMFPIQKREKNDPSIWRQPKGGGTRYCQIPPIHDQDTGVRLQRIIDEEGITAQKAVEEALECYEALTEGRLAWKDAEVTDATALSVETHASTVDEQKEVPVGASEATAAEVFDPSDELEQLITPEEVALQEWGLSLGDTVVWSDESREEMMVGHIYDFTPDVALVDCGQQKPVAIAYPHIKKITTQLIESALSDHRSPHSQIFLKAKSVKALWNVNSIQAEASLNELLKMSWHWKVWIDEQAMSEENRLLFIPGGKDYLS